MSTSYNFQPGDRLAAKALRLTHFNGCDLLYWEVGSSGRLHVFLDLADEFTAHRDEKLEISEADFPTLEATFREAAAAAGSAVEVQYEAGLLFASWHLNKQPLDPQYLDESVRPLFHSPVTDQPIDTIDYTPGPGDDVRHPRSAPV